MPFSLVSGRIENLTTDTGTFTWADIVAAGGSAITLTNGHYHCTAEILVQGGTLNIFNTTLTTTKPINCANTGTSTINVGEKATDANGNVYSRNGCTIRFQCSVAKIGGYVRNDTGTVSIRKTTDRKFNVYGSRVEVNLPGRKDIFLTDCYDAQFHGVGSGSFFIYTAVGARLENSLLSSYNVMEMVGAPVVFSGMSIYEAGNSIMLFEAISSRVQLDSVNFVSANNFGELFLSNRLAFVNKQIDLTKIVFNSSTSTAYNTARFAVKAVGAAGDLADVQMQLNGSNAVNSSVIIASGVSGSTGAFTEALIDRQSTTQTGGVVSHGPFALQLRSFGTLEYTSSLPLTENYGTTAAPQVLFQNADTAVTGTAVQAAAITDIAFSVSSGAVTVTLTANRSSQEIYNYWKHWSSLQANFGVAQNLITLSNGALRVTGTVAVSGSGVALPSGIVDNNGDSFLSFEGVDSWVVFSDAARTTSLATGTSDYRFNYSSGTTYYLTLVVSGEQISKSVTPAASGETVVSLATAAQIQVINTLTNAIKTVTDQFEFNGSDVKATLDGEVVTTDLASRNASKADVSALATVASIAALNDLSAADITGAVPSATATATAVRTNLATELARIDADVSSRSTQEQVKAAEDANFI